MTVNSYRPTQPGPARPHRRTTDYFDPAEYERLTKVYQTIVTITREHAGEQVNGNGKWLQYVEPDQSLMLC